MTDTEQQQAIDPFREMNRYDERDEKWPSEAVFAAPRRTTSNGWAKFHAARDCGRNTVSFIETTHHRAIRERWAWKLYCFDCRHEVDEHEVLFVGGQWYNEEGWQVYGRPLDHLWMPAERVLDLGPDPDEDELRQALDIGRVERGVRGLNPLGVAKDEFYPCEECGYEVPLLFDDRCRMCYDGPWTDRLQGAVDALEEAVRVYHNDSFVHRLPRHVDPLAPTGTAHPGDILWRRHDSEAVPKMVEVTARLEDMDDGHIEYVLWDLTRTNRYRYHEDDLAAVFWDTNLRNEEPKAIMDDRIRAIYRGVCEHQWHEIHDGDTGAVVGEECYHCRKGRNNDAE